MEDGNTDNLIDDIKERRFQTTEYSLDEETGAKAAESNPVSAVGKKERLKVGALDDLHVFLSPRYMANDLKLKKRVHEVFSKKLKPLQKSLASIIFAGKDLLFPLSTVQNAEQVREVYLLHAVNQIYKYFYSMYKC